MPTADTPARPFESLADLRQEHLRLLRRSKDPGHAQPASAEVEAFLTQVQEAGTWLDDPADREAAQGILDYWMAGQLTTVGGGKPRPAPRGLKEFDAGAVGRLADAAERAVAGMPADEQELARRVMLRLVRLKAEGRAFEPAGARRAELEAAGDPARVRPVLAALEQAGVFRVEEQADGPVYAPRYEALTRKWERYATWLDKRVKFRDQVRYWERNDRSGGALIDGPPLSDAMAYHDLTGTEQDYLQQSRHRESRQKRVWQVAFAIAAGLLLVAVAGWVVAALQTRAADSERNTAVSAKNDEKAAKEKAKEEEGKAILAADSAKRAESAAKAAADKATAAEKAATEARHLAEQKTADLLKTAVLANLFEVTQTLARINQSDPGSAERLLRTKRWQNLVKEGSELLTKVDAQEDAVARQVVSFLRPLYGAFTRTDLNKATARGLNDLSEDAIKTGLEVTARLADTDDRVVTDQLKALQRVTFGVVGDCTEQIVTRLRRRDYEGAFDFIREFRVMYWGEMRLLEGDDVKQAMIDFGTELSKIEELIRSRLPADTQSVLTKGDQSFVQNVGQAVKGADRTLIKDGLAKVEVAPDKLTALERQRAVLNDSLKTELAKPKIRPVPDRKKKY